MTPTARVARRNSRRRRIRAAVLLGSLTIGAAVSAPATAEAADHGKPTIVLVHGAWADTSSWSRVVRQLQAQGYPVVAAANPLRSLASDSAYLDTILETIDGPIVLV